MAYKVRFTQAAEVQWPAMIKVDVWVIQTFAADPDEILAHYTLVLQGAPVVAIKSLPTAPERRAALQNLVKADVTEKGIIVSDQAADFWNQVFTATPEAPVEFVIS